jgi:hypothetical protein
MLLGSKLIELFKDKIRGLWCPLKMLRTVKIAKKALILKSTIVERSYSLKGREF